MPKEDTASSVLGGAVTAALAQWSRWDDEIQRRLRGTRDDARATAALLSELQGRGEIIRSRIPTVSDAQIGLALANAAPSAPAMLPSTSATTRPDVASSMEAAVADMSWPPQAGQYDAKGMVSKVGELTTTFLSLTYEEVRAFVQGLAQTKAPSKDGKVQVFYAANTLVQTVAGLKLSAQQYADAWARLFRPTTAAPVVNQAVSTVSSSANNAATGRTKTDFSVNAAAVDTGFSDGSAVMRTGARTNPTGAFTGGGIGNKSILGVFGHHQQPLSALTSISYTFRNIVGPGGPFCDCLRKPHSSSLLSCTEHVATSILYTPDRQRQKCAS